MTRVVTAVLAFVLAFAMAAFAQSTAPPQTQTNPQTNPTMGQPPDPSTSQPTQPPDTTAPPPDTTQPQANQAGAASGYGVNAASSQRLSGTISSDGKTFTSNNGTYSISNTATAKEFANHPVTVEYEMDGGNTIRITKVMLTPPQR